MADFMKLVRSLPADQAEALLQEESESIRRQHEYWDGMVDDYDSQEGDHEDNAGDNSSITLPARLHEDHANSADTLVLDDWSQTGRGSHVDFEKDEDVPLEQGMFLGRGAMGDVYEVNVSGNKLAHKRMVMKRKLGGKERKEIDILKAIPKHHHIIELVGTYTHRQFLGILLYPVAVCDLHTFFEDAEAWHNTASESKTQENRLLMLEASQKSRLLALGYDFPDAQHRYSASLIYSKIGCLISAISYLHDQKIRHKDLKPSNILLSRDRIWLSDFGSATDFSLLSQSATDNERGSPRYFSPEVFAWQPNGRAADIFSLGCVLLEIVVLHDQGMLHHMHTNRSPHPSFHANLDRVDTWLQSPKRLSWSRRRAHLVVEIKSMLAYDPAMRPNARQLLTEIVGYDLSQMTTSKHSVFGTCCRKQLMSLRERQDLVSSHEKAITELQKALFDSNSEQLRLNTEREQRAIQYENSRNEMVVDLTKIKGQMKKAVAKNSKFLRVIGHRDSDLNKLAFELASVKGKLMEREAENVRLVGLVNTLSLQDEERRDDQEAMKKRQDGYDADNGNMERAFERIARPQRCIISFPQKLDPRQKSDNHRPAPSPLQGRSETTGFEFLEALDQPKQPVKNAIRKPIPQPQTKKSLISRITGVRRKQQDGPSPEQKT